MLTRELALAEYRDWKLIPDRLTRARHGGYLDYAQRLLDIYRSGAGRTRRELHMAAREVFADKEDCPPRRIDAFCKLLDDVSVYDRDSRGKSAALRKVVFRAAAAEHPLVRRVDRLFEHNESEVKQQIARQLGRSWEEIDGQLFADIMEFHVLKDFEGYPMPPRCWPATTWPRCRWPFLARFPWWFGPARISKPSCATPSLPD